MHKLTASLILIALIAAAPTSADAIEYEIFIDIEQEEDLYDLQAAGEIGDDTLETLRELLRRGVNLNTASRRELYGLPNLTYAQVDQIIAYRKDAGFIRDPADLVVAGVLTAQELGSIAAFLIVRAHTPGTFATQGRARLFSRWTADDGEVPPFAMRARATTLKNLRVGVAATMTRTRLGEVVYDPNRGALSAEGQSIQPHIPKAYAMWETDKYVAIAGTYRVGFGQKLTFDVSDKIEPNGIYPDDDLFRNVDLVRRCKESTGELPSSPCPRGEDMAGSEFVTNDYGWRDSLLGVAGGLKALEVGSGKVQAIGFMSYQPKSIYQYELYDRATCDDPRNDDDDRCSSPQVFRRQEDAFDPTSRYSFQTLPNMYAEFTAGGNITYAQSDRIRVGVTGYGSRPDFLTEGIELDFQEWSRFPFGGPWGAAGVDFAYGTGHVDVFGEVARSFDRQLGGGGGGLGSVLRGVVSWDKQELELALRHYDDDFANPYSRPIAAADEFDGLRARDETGARLRYQARLNKMLNIRSTADVWYIPSKERIDTKINARVDAEVTDQWRVGGFVQFQNKDIQENGRIHCFTGDVSAELMIENYEDDQGCAGQKYVITPVRVRYAPTKKYSAELRYQHEFEDDGVYRDKYRQDVLGSLTLSAKPADRVRIRGRLRYLWEDISDDSRLERVGWAYVDLRYRLRLRDELRVRYDYLQRFDDRDSTLDRSPNPEHWLWLEYEVRF